jgi:hypothetical protein
MFLCYSDHSVYLTFHVIMIFFPTLQALDTFDLAVVSPIYYVMFTTLTIVASGIMFKVETNI